jgi:sarcosine oxidase delta subunit
MTLACPSCGYRHDVSSNVAGDRIWCSFCARWLMLAFHRGGDAYFVLVQPPVSYPRERRRNEPEQ